jgi:hypothetical protein
MMLIVNPQGVVRCLYDEAIDLTALGPLSLRRVSHVEPDEHGQWWADLSSVHGPKLGPFALRSAALDAEQHWLEYHLVPVSPASGLVDSLKSEKDLPTA